MSVSPIPTNPIRPPVMQAGPISNFRQDFTSLTSALNSGDLSSSQTAYQTLLSDHPAVASKVDSGDSKDPFINGLADIGTALQNGDVGGAQSALKHLGNVEKAVHHHRGHKMHTDQTASSTSDTSPASSTTTPDSTSVNVTA